MEKEKKQKIKNKHYRAFLDNGIMRFISREDITQAIEGVTGKYRQQGRALIIALYFTGGRPIEVLKVKSKDIKKVKSYVQIKLSGSKGGLPRTVYLRYSDPLVRELYQFAQGIFPEMYLFYNFWTKYTRTKVTAKGLKQYEEITDGLRYYFKKWFSEILEDSISPYYLRHNRFSKLSEAGITPEELRILKGSKTMESVIPYLHMSSRAAKKIAKKMD